MTTTLGNRLDAHSNGRSVTNPICPSYSDEILEDGNRDEFLDEQLRVENCYVGCSSYEVVCSTGREGVAHVIADKVNVCFIDDWL